MRDLRFDEEFEDVTDNDRKDENEREACRDDRIIFDDAFFMFSADFFEENSGNTSTIKRKEWKKVDTRKSDIDDAEKEKHATNK